ncbi:hypothetical protein [Streptomyces chrestomyceticus]|uniref:hypothetical protein n=1 Tax=Streptomyces chrestomyceticus TaxID=68185 RepID=UPI0019D11584|nr:hypothetical protein [Streptomyces chrestomyceticus]
MALPSWEDKKLGTMKRAALWLVTEVGEGNVFTKGALRAAFPETSQIDRRMRDLRDHGWRIDTNREDAGLEPHEQRFVTQGEAVWEPGKGRSKQAVAITATQRREIIARDGHFCRSCGISAGQTYPGTYEAAQLDIARRPVQGAGGAAEVQLVTECNRCRVGGRDLTADLASVLDAVRRIGPMERKLLAGWMGQDRRDFSDLERIWADYRSLPADSRAQVREQLGLEGGR